MEKEPVFKYNQKSDEETNLTKRWWLTDPDKAHDAIWPLVNFIRQTQSIRHAANHRFYNMYANQNVQNYNTTSFTSGGGKDLSQHFGSSAQTTYNVIKSCVDTARSKIAKEKPRPFFLTENGDWHLQRKAKKLNSFIMGLFEQMGSGSGNGQIKESLYTIGSEVFLDACISGTGAAKMHIKDNKIVVERFLSDELIVDQFEGYHRAPRSKHQVKYIDRDVLFDLYPEPEHRGNIERATAAEAGLTSDTQDMIPVIESYHLRSGKNAKDGRRVISIQTGTLKSVEWDKDYFPFLIQRWSIRPVGFFGIGLAEELQGIQREINQTLGTIQTGLRRAAVPRVWLKIGDQNTKKRMTNEIGEMRYYRDAPPIFNTATAFNPETYNHVDRLYAKAYETTGISQLSSMAAKPAGLDSGVALRNYQDIESERFATVHQMYENFFIPQATYMALDLLDTLLEAGHDTIIKARDGMTLRPIKYSEVRIEQDDFTVRPYPTAFLPTEPAGKFAKVQEGVAAGMFDMDEARDLLDFPDLQKSNSIKLARRNAAFAYVESLLDTGEYSSIEPYQDIELTRDLCQSYYLEGRTSGMPEDRLDLLRRIMDEIKVRIDEQERVAMEAEAAAMAAAQGAMPQQAQPMAPEQLPPGAPELPPEMAGAEEPILEGA